MSDIVRIPFHGANLIAVDDNGQPHIVLRPALDSLGLDFATQLRKLKGRSWATIGERPTVAADGRTRQLTTVDVRTFLMLLATINENNVAADKRALLIAYQSEVADVVEKYWRDGLVANPRVMGVSRPSGLDAVQALLDEVRRVEADAAEARQIAQSTHDRLDAIEGRHDWFSALGFARNTGIANTSTKAMNRLGKQASAIAREHGITAEKVPHHLYGEVNLLPRWVWELAAQGRKELGR